MKNYKISLAKLPIVVLAILWFFASCSKETQLGVQDETASLTISVAGASPVKSKLKLNASSTEYGNMIGLEPQEYIRKESSRSGRLSMDFITKQDVLGVDFNRVDDGFSKQADITPVDGDVKYIFVLEKVDEDNSANNTFIHSQQHAVSDVRQINGLETNAKYKWYAYSYLTEDAIAVPDPAASLLAPTYHDKTLVHDSGEIFVTGGQNNIAIIFNHQLTQINVEVDVKKAYADITHIKAELIDRSTKVKTGMFDFKSGTISNHTSAIITETDLVFTNKTPGDNSIKVAHYYTSDASLTSFSVLITELAVKYRNTQTPENLIVKNGGLVSFTGFQNNNSGHVLQGKLNLVFTLPQVRILAFSNDNAKNGYRLHTGTGAGDFLRNTKWFGPNSDYVAIDGIAIDPISTANEASHSSTSQNKIAVLLANPANYPEILIIANWYNYLNEASWNAVRRYLDAGGIVLHTQDENETNINGVKRADQFMSNLLGQTVTLLKNPHEDDGVYKFTNTQAALGDNEILKGVFGDVTPYHWGQDRSGTVYMFGYTGNDLIVYSDHAENYKPQPTSGGKAFFRHKTKKYFYVGDGGFYLNPDKGDHNTKTGDYPFRSVKTGIDMDKPLITFFGTSAKSGSPMYNAPAGSGLANNYYRSSGRFQIANSMMFGNMMAWMMEQAYLNPVNKTGPIVNP